MRDDLKELLSAVSSGMGISEEQLVTMNRIVTSLVRDAFEDLVSHGESENIKSIIIIKMVSRAVLDGVMDMKDVGGVSKDIARKALIDLVDSSIEFAYSDLNASLEVIQ